MSRTRILKIIDSSSEVVSEVKLQTEQLPAEFGKNLDTVEKARQWLTNPFNWHTGNIYIIKWDGLTPTVCERHGRRLVNEPEDNGLPAVIVRHQRDLRAGKKEDWFEFDE